MQQRLRTPPQLPWTVVTGTSILHKIYYRSRTLYAGTRYLGVRLLILNNVLGFERTLE